MKMINLKKALFNLQRGLDTCDPQEEAGIRKDIQRHRIAELGVSFNPMSQRPLRGLSDKDLLSQLSGLTGDGKLTLAGDILTLHELKKEIVARGTRYYDEIYRNRYPVGHR